jgi:hypothetical protein
MQPIHATLPREGAILEWCQPHFAASARWRQRTGGWPRAFVADITTIAPDPRADGALAILLACGFALHRHATIDTLETMLEGIRSSGAELVVLCARGSSSPDLVRPFVLAIPDLEYILVTGDPPDSALEREGDPGSRGFYVDVASNAEDLVNPMQLMMRGLGIASR